MLNNRTIAGPGNLLAAGLLALLAPENPSNQTGATKARRNRVKLPRTVPGILMRWQERARGRHDLAALDDRLLRDIGLTAHQAGEEARKPFWKD